MENSPSLRIDDSIEGYLKMAFNRSFLPSTHSIKSQTAYRILYGFSPHCPDVLKGLHIDLYGEVLLLQNQQKEALNPTIIDLLLKSFPRPETMLLQSRYMENGRFQHHTKCLRGLLKSEQQLVWEPPFQFQVQFLRSLDTGLYLDTALVRKWLYQNSKGKRILNLYSYTGSYGVVAMLGGAKDVINVDNSKTALQQAKQNYERNQLPINPRSFCHEDIKDFLRMANKKKDSFDMVIIDPSPPTPHYKTKEEKLSFYINALHHALKAIRPNGQILLSCHSFLDFSEEELRNTLLSTYPTMQLLEKIAYPEVYEISHPKMLVLQYQPNER